MKNGSFYVDFIYFSEQIIHVFDVTGIITCVFIYFLFWIANRTVDIHCTLNSTRPTSTSRTYSLTHFTIILINNSYEGR